MAQEMTLGGFLQLDRRIELGTDSTTIADFYNRFRPELSASIDPRLDLFASLELRFYDFPTASSTSDLEDTENHFPTEMTLWEAYVRLADFLTGGLDLTIGKQRIQWGTADELNPTDQLNAYDFSDLTQFTARVPTWAALFEYYVADLKLTAVWSPGVHPPLLPRGGTNLFVRADVGSEGSEGASTLKDHLELPSRRLSNSTYAFKLSGYMAGFDYSLSYFDGFDGLPVVRRLRLTAASAAPQGGEPAAHAWLTFARIRAAGADLATEVGGAGLWAEGALFFPEEVLSVTQTVAEGDTAVTFGVALEGRPYLKSTVGLDYTFPGGWYVNAQWAHGLFFERGAGKLHDYFVGRLEKKLRRNELKLVAAGAFEIGRWSNISENLGYGFFPEMVYSPLDNIEMVAGAFLVSGRGESLFGTWNAVDQAYLRVKVSF